MPVIRYRHLSLGTQLPPFICQVALIAQCQTYIQRCDFLLYTTFRYSRYETEPTQTSNHPILHVELSFFPCTTYPRLSAALSGPHYFRTLWDVDEMLFGRLSSRRHEWQVYFLSTAVTIADSDLPWLFDSVFSAMETYYPGALGHTWYLGTLIRYLLEKVITNSNLAPLDTTRPVLNFR